MVECWGWDGVKHLTEVFMFPLRSDVGSRFHAHGETGLKCVFGVEGVNNHLNTLWALCEYN